MENYKNIEYRKYEIPNDVWNDENGTTKEKVVKNKEQAIKIAEIIFEQLEYPLKKEKYEASVVLFDDSKGIYIVVFCQKEENILGDEYSIAINENTGKVEKIWAGE